MKKVLVIGLLFSHASLIAAMQWDAQDYAKNNTPQEQAAMMFIERFGFELSEQNVLDGGCGVGNISAAMAAKAKLLIGVDASQAMIDLAKETYKDVKNLAFHCIALEKLTYEDFFTRITSFFCISRIQDKAPVFHNFFKALTAGGSILCTVATEEDKNPLLPVIAQALMSNLEKYPFLKEYKLPYLMDQYPIPTTELSAILDGCGFENIKFERSTDTCEFKTKDEYVAWQRPVFMATPFATIMVEKASKEALEEAFKEFCDLLWDAFEKNNGDGAFYPIATTVVIAQKPA